jgi:hypothetical protein
VLSKLDDSTAVPALKEAAARDLDADLQVHLARAILDLRDPAGFGVLVKVLDSDPPKLAREEALQLAEERSGRKLDAAALKKWWLERDGALKWKNESKRFE